MLKIKMKVRNSNYSTSFFISVVKKAPKGLKKQSKPKNLRKRTTRKKTRKKTRTEKITQANQMIKQMIIAKNKVCNILFIHWFIY